MTPNFKLLAGCVVLAAVFCWALELSFGASLFLIAASAVAGLTPCIFANRDHDR